MKTMQTIKEINLQLSDKTLKVETMTKELEVAKAAAKVC